MSKFTDHRIQTDLLEEAASWYARISSDDITVSECDEFQAWLAANIKHRLAFDATVSTAQQIEQLAEADKQETVQVSSTLAATIDECRQLVDNKQPAPTGNRSHSRIWAVAACLMIAICGALLWQSNRHIDTTPESKRYRTAVGEQRSVLLPDGSMMMMNTNTDASVTVTATDRRIYLKSGEAWFDVAKDPNRPFSVSVGSGTVRALGTSFNIRHRDTLVYVTVTEGTVEVKPSAQPYRDDTAPAAGVFKQSNLPAEPTYGAGELIVFDGDIKQVAKLDLQTVRQMTAWRHGKLIFDNTPLAQMVREMQPYVRQEIIIADESIAALAGGGVFKTDSASSLLSAIAQTMPVSIIRRDDVIILTRKQHEKP